ncbi:MAG: alpha/beta hydrolase family protein, partial [Bacteroidia bacterium]
MQKTYFFLIFCLCCSLQSRAGDFLATYKHLTTISVEDLQKRWKSKGLPEFLMPIHNGIEVYDIDYYTKWHDGSKIKASGLYLVPAGVKKAMPQVIYHHGTSVKKERNMGFNGEETLCYFFASDGYAVVMPDYIGLGRGEKRHLYQHADSEAQAAIDLLEAVNELNKTLNVSANGQLFLTGYSQGGHSAMATHIKLQKEYKGKYAVTASSPMSGAYMMTGPQSETMFRPYGQPHYLPYLLSSYQEAYHIIDGELDSIYRPPYNKRISVWYSGIYQHYQINDSLPKIPANMIKDEIVQEYKNNPNFPFRVRLGENNVHDWKPEAPVQLCYCKSDEEVNYKNSLIAHEAMTKKGAKHVRK